MPANPRRQGGEHITQLGHSEMKCIRRFGDHPGLSQSPPHFYHHHPHPVHRLEVDPETVVFREHDPYLRHLKQKLKLTAHLLGIAGQLLAGFSKPRFAFFGLGSPTLTGVAPFLPYIIL